MSERYIVVRNWETFQHYKDRSPTWIKNYTELLHNEAYRALSGQCRAVLHGLWLEYASSRCQLLVNTSSLSSRLGLRVTMKQLDSLSHAGFITFSASAPLAQRYPREEKSRESTNTLPELKSVAKTRRPTEAEIVNAREEREQAGWVDNLSQYTGCRYARGEVGIHAIYDPLGTEWPPTDWPYQRPTKQEVVSALAEKGATVA